ncbi:hypothetical protein GCM10023318_53820 [Nocardia callitridis]|uniref:Uncharacterized protein n=1 Tax=Nocardia callitridis TaxID=648753 RepID=A0ABP9KUD4_9NOCA
MSIAHKYSHKPGDPSVSIGVRKIATIATSPAAKKQSASCSNQFPEFLGAPPDGVGAEGFVIVRP